MHKICYVVTIPGTIESFFIPQLKYLADNGFDVTVICGSSKTLASQLGEKIHYIPVDMPRGISVVGSLKSIISLYKIFYEEKFDLIQYSTPNAAMYASLAGFMARVKLRNYHLMGFRYLGAKGLGRFILKSMEKLSCSLSTSIECVSNSNLKLGIQEGIFPADKSTVVWNGSTGGVDLDRFDYNKRAQWRKEIRAKLGLEENDFVYGFVGRVTRDKGINELLEAFFRLKDDSKLCIIGRFEDDGTLNKELLNKARDSVYVRFHDSVSDIERYYAALDVLVLPSYREGFGNVVIEAAAVGTPAIVSNIPGPVDAIEKDVTALTVNVKDVDSLSKAMKHIGELDYKQMGRDCVIFTNATFDDKMLCEKILERKQILCMR